MPSLAKNIEGRKYMWDGCSYESKKSAEETEEKYKKDGFQAKIVEENGKFLIYTRREVKEVKVEGQQT